MTKREFFKPWRRRIGVVTLVLACVLMAGWVRSQSMADDIYFTAGDRRNHLRSAYGQFFWGGWPAEGRQSFHRSSDRIADLEAEDFNWGSSWFRETPPNCSIHWATPYSYVTPFLTLLSAYLLLSKPRPATKPEPAPTTDPDHA